MKDEYRIFNATAIQKRIEELEVLKKIHCYRGSHPNENEFHRYNNEQTTLKKFYSQSTPLIREIEKAFDEGHNLSGRANFRKGTKEYNSYINKQDYISNLKLDV